MSNEARIMRGALIGCGYFGQIQLEAWRRMSGVEIVAACDVSLDKANAVAPQAYTAVEKMFDSEDLDFVDIADTTRHPRGTRSRLGRAQHPSHLSEADRAFS